MEMTNRERVLNTLNRRPVDRFPWMARLSIWYSHHKKQGTLPEEFEEMTLREAEEHLGIDESARDVCCYRKEWQDVEIRKTEENGIISREFLTPVGTVSTRTQATEYLHAMTVEHMVKTEADYPVVEFMYKNRQIIPTPEKVAEYDEKIGDAGLPMVWLDLDPMSWIMRSIVGQQNFYYHLADFPERIESLYEVMTEQCLQIQDAALACSARLVLQGNHFEGSMVPPPMYEKYMLPYFREFADRLHEEGKWMVCHADADTRLLVDLLKDSGYDVLDCFASAPLVPFELEDARRQFGEDVIIWGGVPSTILCDPYTDEEFEEYMEKLFTLYQPGDPLMLGVSDNIMPETHIERVRRVGEMVRRA